MKSLQLKFAFLFLLSISFMSCAQKSNEENNSEPMEAVKREKVIHLISPAELQKKNSGIQLIDVRTPEEYAEGHVKNAVNINYYDADFMDQMEKLDKNKDIYVYCRSGGRSGKTANKLSIAGFKKIYDLQGGMNNWKKSGLAVDK